MYPPPRKKGKRAKWYLFSCPHIYIPCTQCRVIYQRRERMIDPQPPVDPPEHMGPLYTLTLTLTRDVGGHKTIVDKIQSDPFTEEDEARFLYSSTETFLDGTYVGMWG